jgi:hypothetical protein
MDVSHDMESSLLPNKSFTRLNAGLIYKTLRKKAHISSKKLKLPSQRSKIEQVNKNSGYGRLDHDIVWSCR